jgi:hypothetical protein
MTGSEKVLVLKSIIKDLAVQLDMAEKRYATLKKAYSRERRRLVTISGGSNFAEKKVRAKPVSVSDELGATYTEGVCDDGAAILRDGLPMRVSEVLDALNRLPPSDPVGAKE